MPQNGQRDSKGWSKGAQGDLKITQKSQNPQGEGGGVREGSIISTNSRSTAKRLVQHDPTNSVLTLVPAKCVRCSRYCTALIGQQSHTIPTDATQSEARHTANAQLS